MNNDLERANTALKQGKYEEAYELFSSMKYEGVQSIRFLGLAKSLYFLGKYDLALENAKRTIETDPKSAEAHLLLGNIYCRQKSMEAALEETNQALELMPEMIDALVLAGELLVFKRDLANGMTLLEKAIKLDPTNWLANYNLGIANMISKQYQLAQEKFSLSFQQKPSLRTVLRLVELYFVRHPWVFRSLQIAVILVVFISMMMRSPLIPTIVFSIIGLLGLFYVIAEPEKKKGRNTIVASIIAWLVYAIIFLLSR